MVDGTFKHCTIVPSWRSVKDMKTPTSKDKKKSLTQIFNVEISNPTNPQKPRMLDLFSGTGSVGKAFEERGFEVISVDIDPQFKPTIVADVLAWNYRYHFKPGCFDVVFCSPPCANFSRAKTTAPRDLESGDALVLKALEIVKYLKPKRWFLENPRSGLLPTRPYMRDIPYVDVDYCQFAPWGYQKPTRIWGDNSIKNISTKVCDGVSCPNMVDRPNGRKGHIEILGGLRMRVTRLQKYRVPEALICHLCGWAEPERRVEAIKFLNAMQLCPIPTARFEPGLPESEINAIAHHIDMLGELPKFVASVVQANDKYPGEDVEALRQQILQDYADSVFADHHNHDPPIRGPFGEATITVKPGVTPVKQRPFQLHGERQEALKTLIDQLEGDGKIEDGVGPWNSPSFPVATKTPGKWRFVVDFRRLNDATETDAHPLPRIEDILNKQGKCVIWSVLDMKDGYHQVPLRLEDRPLTCMSTPRGTKQWRVLAMGLKNGGAIFQRMMEWVLQPCECADPYIDDVIVGSQGTTREEALKNHERDLRQVLDRLKEHKLLVGPLKTKLFMREVEFCGHVLSEGRKQPAPGKLLSIQKWQLPQTVTQLRGFLGLTNYYSCYVDHYAEFAGPLMGKLQLSREDGKKGSQKRLTWRKCEIESFEELKKRLAQSLELFIVDPDSPFVLWADASDKAIGAVLEQDRVLQPGGPIQRVPVGFSSRKLAKSQFNWTPREKETYAIVSALRKWAGWIGLQPVTITTDHKSLEDWVLEKMDTPSGPAGRRARWHETLSKFDLTVQYIPGKDNVVADALSRFAYPASKAFQDTSFHGSEAARQEMKAIIEEELAEGRTVGLISPAPTDGSKIILFVAGTLSKRLRGKIPEWQIYHVATSSCLNPNAKPFIPTSNMSQGILVVGGQDLLPEFQFKRRGIPIQDPQGEVSSSSNAPPPPILPPISTNAPSSSSNSPSTLGDPQAPSNLPLNPPPPPPIVPAPPHRSAISNPVGPENWDEDYAQSEQWGTQWNQIKSQDGTWPEGIRFQGGVLIEKGLICVPESKILHVIKTHHEKCGHPGVRKLVNELTRRYIFPLSTRLMEVVTDQRRKCLVCQGCDPPNWSGDSPLEHTPIPPHIMSSVAIDIFSLPSVEWRGNNFDSLLVCVDRHSGWIIARPCTKVGLTAERAAHLMLDGGWETFGIPSVITSDQGPQFAGQWWKTMCARLGIRQAYSQAYRSKPMEGPRWRVKLS